MKNGVETVGEVIRGAMNRLSPGERAIGHAVLTRMEEIPFVSAVELATELRLSNATVTRFSQRLGFEGYVDLQHRIRTELRGAYSPQPPSAPDDLFGRALDADLANLESLRTLPVDALDAAVTALVGARRVWTGGILTTRPLAEYATYYLGLFRPRVSTLVESVRARPDGLLDVASEDAAVLFTVRRYSKATTELGRALCQRGVAIVLVTDDGAPPVAQFASAILRCPSRSGSSMPSITSLISVVQALGLMVAARGGTGRTGAMERLVEEFDAYEY